MRRTRSCTRSSRSIAKTRCAWRKPRISSASAGFVRGPLHGLPIAIKDLFHIEGRQTTAGSKSWLGRISTETALCVERLLDAGMIPLGKTHLVEFAYGTWGTNKPMGTPWNPWDLRVHRVAGGSSSGSAVAVAVGHGARGARDGHRRIGPDSRGVVRAGRIEADVRTHSAGRRRTVVARRSTRSVRSRERWTMRRCSLR